MKKVTIRVSKQFMFFDLDFSCLTDEPINQRQNLSGELLLIIAIFEYKPVTLLTLLTLLTLTKLKSKVFVMKSMH